MNWELQVKKFSQKFTATIDLNWSAKFFPLRRKFIMKNNLITKFEKVKLYHLYWPTNRLAIDLMIVGILESKTLKSWMVWRPHRSTHIYTIFFSAIC